MIINWCNEPLSPMTDTSLPPLPLRPQLGRRSERTSNECHRESTLCTIHRWNQKRVYFHGQVKLAVNQNWALGGIFSNIGHGLKSFLVFESKYHGAQIGFFRLSNSFSGIGSSEKFVQLEISFPTVYNMTIFEMFHFLPIFPGISGNTRVRSVPFDGFPLHFQI